MIYELYLLLMDIIVMLKQFRKKVILYLIKKSEEEYLIPDRKYFRHIQV